MKKIFAANWKLFKTPNETRSFFEDWNQKFKSISGNEVVFFPPATSLEAISQSLKGSATKWGSQNCYCEVKGAFTGETSAQVVKDLGGSYVLLGHSERRSLFHESNEMISKKFALVQSLDLIPMLCIGETLTERQTHQTERVLKGQLERSLELADSKKKFVIAYEPVWAIGTGQVATSEQVKDTHAAVYELLQSMGFSKETAILYGGSVKPDNAKELIAIQHVDGFLVGGASLEVSSFAQICNSAG